MLGTLNPAPADAVRGGVRHEDVVADYAEKMRSGGTFPPPPVFASRKGKGWVYFLADGGYRVAAVRSNGGDSIRCLVTMCDSPAEAEREAYKAALAANETHGVRRTTADKRAAVLAALARPEYAEASDRAIAKLCGVDHKTVASYKGDIRADRSNADTGDFPTPQGRSGSGDSPAAMSNGTTPDGDGHADPAVFEHPDPAAPPNPPFVSDAGSEPVGAADDKGRPVPEALVPAFAARVVFKRMSFDLANLLKALTAAAAGPGGEALSAVRNALEVDLTNAAAAIRANAPYVLCPAPHMAESCGHCGGRGWVTEVRYQQLPADLKAKCEVVVEGGRGWGAD